MSSAKLEGFIQQSQIVHSHKYDYSLTDYKNKKKKVVIICPIHGQFQQLPQNHLKGHGCEQCGANKRKAPRPRVTTEQFIQKAQAIHGDRYDYSAVDYKKALEKVTIICRTHGPFSQRPNDHLFHHGCPTCGGILSNTKIPHSSRKKAGEKAAATVRKKGIWPEVMRKRSIRLKSLPLEEQHRRERDRISKYRNTRTTNGKMIPTSQRGLYDIYCRAVAMFTGRSIKAHGLENYDKKGPIQTGGWHVDHQLSKRDGFLLNIPPYIVGSIHNLMMLPGVENSKKNYKSWITPDELFERYFGSSGGGRE